MEVLAQVVVQIEPAGLLDVVEDPWGLLLGVREVYQEAAYQLFNDYLRNVGNLHLGPIRL